MEVSPCDISINMMESTVKWKDISMDTAGSVHRDVASMTIQKPIAVCKDKSSRKAFVTYKSEI